MNTSNEVECCVCYEKENFLGCINCYTCRDGIICIECVEAMNADFDLKCPCCRSDINHYNIHAIVSEFLHNLTLNPIANPLYERLYNNYKHTETYELYQCCY